MDPKILDYVTAAAQGRHKAMFGKKALVTKLGDVNIVHLDKPNEETIRQRIKEVIEEEILGQPEDDCPLCREMRRHPYDIIYDGLEC